MMYFRRHAPAPSSVRTALIVPTNQYPALADWVWSHPWVAPEVIRRVLQEAFDNGTLDSVLKQIACEEESDA